jgi:hypothetical protein
MRDNRWRRIRAAVAGALAAIILVAVAAVAIRSNIVTVLDHHRTAPDTNEALVVWPVLGTLMAIGGGAMGIAGSARRIVFRATATGAVLFALLAETVPLLPASDPGYSDARPKACAQTWAFAALASFLSLTSYAGACAAGERSKDGWRPMQLSLRELFLVFVPFAVFCAYISQRAMLK